MARDSTGISPVSTFLLAAAATVLVIATVMYPDVAFNAAVQGLHLWWEIAFPALLPFFVGGQMLMGLGAVNFLGVFLEPLMRPLFNLPGVGGFITAMGLASGYPIGAVLTARLRHTEEVTPAEGERLMSFANTADPLFMAGAVAVGMFGTAAVAGTLMAAHYIAAVGTGFLLRFWRPGAPATPADDITQGGVVSRAYREMMEARRRDGRPFGKLFGDCIKASMETLFLIGGFIIVFAVMTAILNEMGFVELFAHAAAPVMGWFGVAPGTGSSLVGGIFEITLGSQLAAEAGAPLADRLIVASAIIGWAGMSVHAQVAAIIQGTGMSMVPYIGARIVHALLAGLATAVLLARGADVGWLPAIPVFSAIKAVTAPVSPGWLNGLLYSSRAFIGTAGLMALGALAIGIFTTIRHNFFSLYAGKR